MIVHSRMTSLEARHPIQRLYISALQKHLTRSSGIGMAYNLRDSGDAWIALATLENAHGEILDPMYAAT